MTNRNYLVAILTALASVVTATTVTLGTFGYTRSDNPAGFKISSVQFLAESNSTPLSVYGDSLPVGSKVWVWSGNGYASSEYEAYYDRGAGMDVTNWTDEVALDLGKGHWVQFPSMTQTIISGDVPQSDYVTNEISMGFQICSYPYPVDRVVTNLGFSPGVGDKIWVWNGAGYASSEYEAYYDRGAGMDVTNWTSETLSIKVGEGFWYEATDDSQWIVQRPY